MNIVRNILAVILGFFIGGLANMGVLTLGHALLPPPEGFDGTSMEGIASTIHLLSPIDLSVPFLAHSAGTFVGVLSSMFIAATSRKTIALILGMLFLIGGVIANVMIPAPIWFRLMDVVIAYIPMAFLAQWISRRT